MNTITIKNVPPVVHRALKARAKAHGRSLNQEILATLEASVRSMPIITSLGRRKSARMDLEILNSRSDTLNEEAEDVLGYT